MSFGPVSFSDAWFWQGMNALIYLDDDVWKERMLEASSWCLWTRIMLIMGMARHAIRLLPIKPESREMVPSGTIWRWRDRN
jgi:hypothetical protein